MTDDLSHRTDRANRGGFLVKIETCDRDGRLLHNGESAMIFPDRQSAVDDIKRHLSQFDETGYDEDGGFWWGRSNRAPCQQARYFVEPV